MSEKCKSKEKRIMHFAFSVHHDEILCMVVSHNNEQIVTGSRDRLIIVMRLETGEVEHSIEQHTDAVTAVALTQDDGLLITGWLFNPSNKYIESSLSF